MVSETGILQEFHVFPSPGFFLKLQHEFCGAASNGDTHRAWKLLLRWLHLIRQRARLGKGNIWQLQWLVSPLPLHGTDSSCREQHPLPAPTAAFCVTQRSHPPPQPKRCKIHPIWIFFKNGYFSSAISQIATRPGSLSPCEILLLLLSFL